MHPWWVDPSRRSLTGHDGDDGAGPMETQRQDPTQRRLASRRDAAEMLGVSVRTVDRLLTAGDLAAVHVGSRCLIPVADIDAFVDEAEAPA